MKHLMKLILGTLIISLVSAWSQPPNKPTTSKEVVEAFLNASGGLEKWKNLKNIQAGGFHEQEDESFSFAFYSYYSHTDSRMKYESDRMSFINSPTEYWLKGEGRDWKNVSKTLKMMDRTPYGMLLKDMKTLTHPIVFLLRIYADRPQVLELAENPIADSNDIALVLVPDKAMDSHKKNLFTDYYLFDSSTGLLNKTLKVDDNGDVVIIESHSDYREVDGFIISHTQEAITMKTTNASLGVPSLIEGAIVTNTYTSFKFNEEIDPKVFMVE